MAGEPADTITDLVGPHARDGAASVAPMLAAVQPAGSACAVSTGDRLMRAIMSLVLGATALGIGNLWCAVPMGVCSVLLMIGAITGYCPGDYVTALRQRWSPLGARQAASVDSHHEGGRTL